MGLGVYFKNMFKVACICAKQNSKLIYLGNYLFTLSISYEYGKQCVCRQTILVRSPAQIRIKNCKALFILLLSAYFLRLKFVFRPAITKIAIMTETPPKLKHTFVNYLID